MSKIVIMESLGISDSELAMRKKPFEEAGHTFVDYPKTTDTEKLIRQAKDADAMIIANMPMPGEVISRCDNLKFIDVAFTGVDQGKGHKGKQCFRLFKRGCKRTCSGYGSFHLQKYAPG